MVPSISFIVPVYNSEKTLARCVNSLFSQGIPEDCFEIILVNDGSTDRSGALCQEFSDNYPFVKSIHQHNTGLSGARNRGIQAAQGEYLCFVDADDCLSPGGIASLLTFCDGNNDLIRFWCELIYPESNRKKDMGDGRIVFSGYGLEYLRIFGLETFCTTFLYRRLFLVNNKLFFSPGILGEDFSFIFDYLMANPRLISVAQRIYQFIISPNSITTNRTPEHSRRWVRDLMGTDCKMTSLFSRCLSSQYTMEEYRRFLSSCRAAGLLPQQSGSPPFIAVLTRIPFLYPFAGIIFRRLFLPYIYPKIDRYGK